MEKDEEKNKMEFQFKKNEPSEVTGNNETDGQETPKGGNRYHSLEDFGVSGELSVCLKNQWIETVEQAVGYLATCGFEIEGKEQFLTRAKELLGKDAFEKYSTPAQEHPFGYIRKDETQGNR